MFNNELWQKPAGGADDFYTHQIAKSVRVPANSSTSSNNGRLTRTFGTVDSSVHWTLNFWIKRSAIEGNNPVAGARPLTWFTPRSGTSGSVLNEFKFCSPTAGNTAGDSLMIVQTNSNAIVLSTNNLFRDTSAWYNIHIQADLDNGTNSERLKFFINGTEASYNTDNRGSYTSLSGITAGAWTIGDYHNYGYPIQCYFAQWAYVDGYTHPPTDFGESKNGVWIPKDLSSGITWGSAGHLLDFADASALGNDVSGNNNDWTTANIDTHDQMVDSPTFGSSSTGNCCTLNPLTNQSGLTVSENNLKLSRSSAGNVGIPTTMGAFQGKYYFEVYWNNDTQVGNYKWGFIEPDSSIFGSNAAIEVPVTYSLGNNSGQTSLNGSSINMNGRQPTTGTIIGIAIDFDNGKIFYGQDGGSGSRAMNWNNSSTGTGVPQSGTNPAQTFTAGSITLIPAFSISSIGDTNWILNFGQSSAFSGALTSQGNTDDNGQGDFYYSPPTGFTGWTTGGLTISDAINPALTSDDYPQKLFSPLLYTGDGGSSRAITGVGFQPDWVWIKRRNAAENNNLYDSSRGVNKRIKSNSDGAETTEGLPAFGSDGFTVDASGGINNVSSQTYVAWNWRANAGSLTTNNVGTQTSYTQTDPSGAFSITKYAGTGSAMTVGHGLSIEPKITIIKDRDAAVSWVVYTKAIDGSMDYFILDTDTALGTSGLTGPNSSVWTWQSVSGFSNTSGRNYIMYNFANVEGYCKVGTYIGNANDDGTFLPTGFKPAFFMCKPILTGNWRIQDTTRSPFNVADKTLFPNQSDAEESNDSQYIDILSNGIKMRANDSNYNQATTFLYLAMAENPFKYATAR